MDDKVIISNRGALKTKYGAKGFAAVNKALTALKAADKKRGLATRVVWLDDAAAMKKLGGVPVGNAVDPRQNKRATDAVYKALQPDYLMILGAADVVPHQDLDNPVFEPGRDDDAQAWGDLPYACDAGYSRDPAAFTGPSRVVGRLPDLAGATEPSHLLKLLGIAAGWQRRPRADYQSHFGLSAKVWKGSTQMSLDRLFGSGAQMMLSPPSGPSYPAGQLKVRTHFINCHGGQASPEFSGQSGNDYPIALTSATSAGQIQEGTLASVECCYGAELYDSVTLDIDPPICQSYLAQGAYAYLGSTTIAYGPPDDNGAADLICRYFLESVLAGASTGRAALTARQRFVANAASLDPIDLKTLAQFCLLGDPAIHPVEAPSAAGVPKGVAGQVAERFMRGERRTKLRLTGAFLQKSKATASRRDAKSVLSAAVRKSLAGLAEKAGIKNAAFVAYAVRGGLAAAPPKAAGGAKAAKAGAAAPQPSRYLVALGSTPRPAAPQGFSVTAVVAKEHAGRIVSYRVYERR